MPSSTEISGSRRLTLTLKRCRRRARYWLRRSISSRGICPAHWNGVWLLGENGEIETWTWLPPRGASATTLPTRATSSSRSSLVSVGRPIMK